MRRRHLQPESDGAIVDECDLHVCTETARLDKRMTGLRLAHRMSEQSACLIGWRSRREGWTGAAAGIGGQRELRYQQHAAADLSDIQVHLAISVIEDTVSQQLGQQRIGFLFGIAALGAQQHQQTLGDLSNDLAIDPDAGLGDSLQ